MLENEDIEQLIPQEKEFEINISKDDVEKDLIKVPIRIDDEIVKYAIYNPKSLKTKKLISDLYDKLSKVDKDIKKIKFTKEEMELLDSKLENIEEFEITESTFSKNEEMASLTSNGFKQLEVIVDEIFGEGIFDTLTKYGNSGEFLYLLLEKATNDIGISRNEKISPFLRNKKAY